MRRDLSTSQATGYAIDVTTNNVTIDCNDFKIGGLAAGDSSTANGIFAQGRQNSVVRHCSVRGFYKGIALEGGNAGGSLVEDNRLDNNLYTGISVGGDNNLVQRNRVFDTGGGTAGSVSYGIVAQADVLDNTVAGVFSVGASHFPVGIRLTCAGCEARGNRVRGLSVDGSGAATGIQVVFSRMRIDGNLVSQDASTPGGGIDAYNTSYTVCTNNVVINFSGAYNDCAISTGNVELPAP
jgi:parallel beta-helix repeat protein